MASKSVKKGLYESNNEPPRHIIAQKIFDAKLSELEEKSRLIEHIRSQVNLILSLFVAVDALLFSNSYKDTITTPAEGIILSAIFFILFSFYLKFNDNYSIPALPYGEVFLKQADELYESRKMKDETTYYRVATSIVESVIKRVEAVYNKIFNLRRVFYWAAVICLLLSLAIFFKTINISIY